MLVSKTNNSSRDRGSIVEISRKILSKQASQVVESCVSEAEERTGNFPVLFPRRFHYSPSPKRLIQLDEGLFRFKSDIRGNRTRVLAEADNSVDVPRRGKGLKLDSIASRREKKKKKHCRGKFRPGSKFSRI